MKSSLVKRILETDLLRARPPVLLDIGAAGGLPPRWRALASHSIGLAFDADAREFDSGGSAVSGWQRLHLLNQLVTAEPLNEIEFHLTASPQCSSTLRPDTTSLRAWAFRDKFNVERTVMLRSISLPEALVSVGLDRIDWFKCDSQGTDLRLFRSLPEALQARVLAADFEPGIISAYDGEDKLHGLMAYMDRLPFWVSAMKVKGSQRIGTLETSEMSWAERALPVAFYKTAPGWCEISYLNRCDAEDSTERDLLLAMAFSLIQGHLGAAAELARRGAQRFSNPLCEEAASTIRNRIRWRGRLRLLDAGLAAIAGRVWS